MPCSSCDLSQSFKSCCLIGVNLKFLEYGGIVLLLVGKVTGKAGWLHGDCGEMLELISSKSFKLCFTSKASMESFIIFGGLIMLSSFGCQ